ncbi:MAG: B12-binding domain-containing radical SAM protein [PVC group bacterium]|nr:B12-binding domain-containing radical SAM protein [PVC group bacterium]
MEKVTLISFYPGFFGLNLRQIGACLQEAGFEVNYLHLGYAGYIRGSRAPSLKSFVATEEIMNEIIDDIRGSLYVGISLAASEFCAASDFTKALKEKLDIPVIWGGPHPTASFEDSVNFTDFVCVGEGDKTAVELAQKLARGEDVYNIPNLAYLKEGKCVLNPMRPLIEDLNSLPVLDTKIYQQKVFLEGKLQILTPELIVDIDRIYKRPVPDKIIYLTALSRGCPNSCSYCNNSYLKRIYEGQRYFRFRSLDHLFKEIKLAIENIKVIGAVFLADDNITAMPLPILKEFCDRWKKEVGLPFGTSGSPSTIKDEKFALLAKTGLLYKFGIGVESASKRILKIYNRRETPEQTFAAISIVEKYRNLFYEKHIPSLINYQFIFDNPYENTDDIIVTLKFILRLPVRTSITCFHLIMYPGSAIYNKAIKDGFIKKEKNIYMEEFTDISPTFVRMWLKLFTSGYPKWILKVLLLKPVFMFFDSFIFRWYWKKI